MRTHLALLALAACCGLPAPLMAIEGNSAAGPIGGTDIRSAMLPPPGLWGGGIYVHAVGRGFTDGNGDDIPALSGLDLTRDQGAALLIYVPPIQIFGSSIGFAGVFSGGEECGRLFAVTPGRCITGFGDIYLEADWSRFFGQLRPSQYPGAFPIAEGLTAELGFGLIVPTGN